MSKTRLGSGNCAEHAWQVQAVNNGRCFVFRHTYTIAYMTCRPLLRRHDTWEESVYDR